MEYLQNYMICKISQKITKKPQLSMEIKRTHALLVTKSQDCGEPNNLLYI